MKVIVAIIFSIATLLFALSNIEVVSVQFLVWQIQASLALVIAGTFLVGFALGALWLTPGLMRHRSTARRTVGELDAVKKERDTLSERATTLEQQVQQLAPLETGGTKNVDPLK